MSKPTEKKTAHADSFYQEKIEKLEAALRELQAEKKQAEAAHAEHLYFLESMEKVDQAILQEPEIEPMLKNVVETVFDIFHCDRAWLLNPCDPDAPFFQIPIEAYHPAYPGAMALSLKVPMTPDMAGDCREALAADGPITHGPGNERPISGDTIRQFSVQTQMFMAIYPKSGKPWTFGLHQCAYPRVWSDREKKLFNRIGRRISDGLSSLLFLKDLKESNSRYQLLHDTMNEGLVVLNTRNELTYANNRFSEMLGYPLAEMMERNIGDFLDEKNNAIVNYQISLRKEGTTDPYELVWVKRGGGTLPTIMSPRPIWGANGRYDGSFAVITNISERKRAEAEKEKLEVKLRQVHKMEAIGTLAGGIAHDFNNILAIIIGNTDMALHSLPAHSPVRRQIDAILKAGLRARDLIRHILTFGRASEHKLRPLKPSQVVSEALQLLRAVIPASIEIHQDIDKNCKSIQGDPTQIHQIVMNLATNAAHAMDTDGGQIEVSLNNVTLGERDLTHQPDAGAGDYVRLRIRDTGSGIAPEIIDRIFDPYFTTKDVDQGSGIGLTVVHGIVKHHGGFISVESERDSGTIFQIYFPGNGAGEIPAPEEGAPLPSGTERVLFIDDEEMVATAGKEVLSYLGYSVTAKTSSTDALETFRTHPDQFDIVITDQTMPELSGAELSKELMKIRPDIPIILCTGYSSQIDEATAREIGIRAYATKPLMNKDIAELIRNVMDAPNSPGAGGTKNAG